MIVAWPFRADVRALSRADSQTEVLNTLGAVCRCAHTITWALKQISSSAQYARASGKTEICSMLASGRSAGHMQDTGLLHGHSVSMMCIYKNGNINVIVE